MTGHDPDVPTPRLRAGPPPPGDSTAGHGPEAAPTRLADAVPAPQHIGPYAVVRTVGRGGMSVVYLARDERDGREVALKVIPAGPDADPTDLARFRAEGQAVRRLDHPNIVKLFDVDEADGLAYIAMEYVAGGTLYRRISRGRPIDPLDAARVAEALARAVHYAHQHGIVHRDLKPSNIMLQKPAAGGPDRAPGSDVCTPTSDLCPKVTDFGLARLLNDSPRLTRAGTAVGTPHYMAPEQARGEDEVSPAIDVHGLGAILYEMLTGLPPFNGSNPADIMDQVVHKVPTPPSQLRAGVPPGLEAICQKCLEKDPRDRYRTAAALADDLQKFLANPTDATLPIRVRRKDRPGRRWLLGVVGGPIALALLAVGITLLLTSQTHRAVVQAHREHADTLRQEADAAARAERRTRLELAVHLCERGEITRGLGILRALDGDPELPVRELVAAWEGRVLTRAARQPAFTADVVALSPRGNRAATATGRAVRLWDADAWAAAGEPWDVGAAVTALAWDPDGQTLAVGTADGRVLRGTVATLQLAPEDVEPGKPVTAVAFVGGQVRYLRQGESRARTAGAKDPDADAAGPAAEADLSPVTGAVAAVRPAGGVRVFDPADGHWHPLPPDGDAAAVAYSTDGNVLAVGSRAGIVRLWDAVARVPLTEAVPVGNGPVQVLAVGVVGREYRVLAGTRAGPPVELRCGRPFAAPPLVGRDQPAAVTGLAFSTAGPPLYVTTAGGVAFWRFAGDRYEQAWFHPVTADYSKWTGFGRFAGCGVCPPGPWRPEAVVVGGTGGKVMRLSPDGQTTVQVATAAGAEVSAVAVDRTGHVCACGRRAGKGAVVRHWDAGLRADSGPAREFDCQVRAEAFLPDGSAVLLGCDDGLVRVWNPVEGRDVRPPLDARSPVLSVAVSPDGGRVLAGCADGTAHLWDRASGEELLVVRHGSEVRGVGFAGPELLTAGGDGRVRLWHAATGLPMGPPLAHPDALTALSVGGELVATGDRDGYVRVWRLR